MPLVFLENLRLDSYYSHSSSASYVRNVSVPLLCVSALDDPVCTREAIPCDECRWVRAVDEFLGVLQSSPLVTRAKVQESTVPAPLKSLIDQGPYVNVVEDGMVAAASTVAINNVVEDAPNESVAQLNKDHDDVSLETENDNVARKKLHENNLMPQSQQNADADDLIVPMRRHIDQLS